MDEHDAAKEVDGSPPADSTEVDRANSDSGIGAIYSELASLAARYRISDAAVVLMNETFGTQIFRLRGRAVSADLVNELGSHPGVYCTPDIVPQGELDTVYAACQQSFASRFVRFNTAQVVGASHEKPQGESEELELPQPHAHHKLEDMETPTSHVALARLRKATSPRSEKNRALVSRFLILVDVAVFILTVGSFHGPARIVLGLVFGVFVPGWCIVGLLKLDNAPLEFGLTVAVSLSLLMVVAQILITINEWHLGALEIAICIVCLPFLILLSRVQRPVE